MSDPLAKRAEDLSKWERIAWDHWNQDPDSPGRMYRAIQGVAPHIETKAILENAEPFLGLATTMQLIDELEARAKVANGLDEKWPWSLEVTGRHIKTQTTLDLLEELKYRVHASDNSGEEWPSFRTVDATLTINVDGGG